MIRYKLTDETGNTYGGMHWEPGITNRATGNGTELCTDGFIHGYETPEQAAFMRPTHVPGYTRLWKIEVPEVCITDGTKEGYKEATCICEVPLPVLGPEQLVAIAIRVGLMVYGKPGYVRWARDWLSGKDRSATAAESVLSIAENLQCAVESARSAAWSAMSAENAVRSAQYAARSAMYAAENARKIDLVATIREVLK